VPGFREEKKVELLASGGSLDKLALNLEKKKGKVSFSC